MAAGSPVVEFIVGDINAEEITHFVGDGFAAFAGILDGILNGGLDLAGDVEPTGPDRLALGLILAEDIEEVQLVFVGD